VKYRQEGGESPAEREKKGREWPREQNFSERRTHPSLDSQDELARGAE
jgi:hypothetical protein